MSARPSASKCTENEVEQIGFTSLSPCHQAVAELSQRVLTEENLDRLMGEAARYIVRVLGVEYGGVFALGQERTALHLKAGAGWSRAVTCTAALPVGDRSLAGSVLESREPVTIACISSRDGCEIPPFLTEHKVLSGISAPIRGLDHAYGLLGGYTTKERTFHAHEVDFVAGLAHLIAEAVRLAQTPDNGVRKRGMLRAAAHEFPALVWITDTDLRIQHVLGARLALFGKHTEYLGKTLFEFFDTQCLDYPPIAAHLSALKGRAATFRYRLDDLLLDVRVTPLWDPERELLGCIGTAIDISERDDVEKQLRLLSTAVESAANAIVIADRHGEIRWVNPAFTQLTGYTLEEVLGRCFLESDVDEEDLYRELWGTIQSGQVWHGEVLSRRKDGSCYAELQTITPVSDSDRRISHFISIRQDVTELKDLEEQFRQAQRMEAIGKLAGGVAHDFNNLLTAIVGYSDLLLCGLQSDDPRRPDLLSIKKAADRAASLTRQLLAFSRRQVLQPKVLDLNATVANLEKMLRRLIGEDVELVAVLDESLFRIKADPGQVEQVILNLALNARDAMPNGGKLTIETQNVQLGDAYYQKQPIFRPGPYVMLAVSDTGQGIDKELLPHVFEPFFTAREGGKGAGLGLSTVYGIVKQSGGYIFAYSELRIGTTFKVYLPRVDEGQERDEAGKEERHVAGSETILLVEDEDEVRGLTRRILKEHGYEVLEASNGAEALLLSQEHVGPIQLLLTDVIMPVMSGPEAADRLSRVRGDMKVLFMSGYADEAIARHGVLEPGSAFIQKPFTRSTLLSKVRDVLDLPRSGGGSVRDNRFPSNETQ